MAGLYGLLAGAVTALAWGAMKFLEHALWSGVSSAWLTGAMIMTGGVCIAAIRYGVPQTSMDALMAVAHDPEPAQRRWVFAVASMAIVAVAFGGAVGPEAGLIAVVVEISSWVVMKLTKHRQEQRALNDVAVTASLAGWYASPVAAATQENGDGHVPKPLLWWAAWMGMLGFGITATQLLDISLHRMEWPAYVAPRDGLDLLWSILPALMGAGMGWIFVNFLPHCRDWLRRSGGGVRQTLLGSAIFACMAALLPILRFSGHHELSILAQWHGQFSGWALLGIGLMKILALCVCLASGWLGGAIFPLLMAGACAGLAVVGFLPEIPLAVALTAGMAGAATVGTTKPWMSGVVVLFLTGGSTLNAAAMGVFIGYLLLRRWPQEPAAH